MNSFPADMPSVAMHPASPSCPSQYSDGNLVTQHSHGKGRSRVSLTEGAAEEGGVGSVGSGANGTVLMPALLFLSLMTVGEKLCFWPPIFLF